MNSKKQKGHFSRRNLLKISAGAVGAGVVTAGLGAKLVFPDQAVAENDMTPDQALRTLMEGNQRFITRKVKNINQGFERLGAVAKTQKPFAAILSCADSRVPSEILFDRGFGDLFVCRVAGNIATPEETGSLEFGSLVLGTKVIMVMGHERCGAVDATIKGAQVPGQIGSLLEAIKPGVEKSKGKSGDSLENAIKANVLVQVEKLKSSPVISQLIQEGKLKVVGSYYDLDTGKVTLLS
ncbi:MAG: carbonic anhydrase [Cyanobacteriota bacterium]